MPFGNSAIDFDNLSQDQVGKIGKGVKAITEYVAEQKAIRESINQTLEDLANDLDADKDSTKQLKKTVKKAATAVATNRAHELQNDNSAVEQLLKKIGEL